MEEFLKKKNIINLLFLAIMVLAVPLTIKLVRQQQILFSRAAETKIEFLTKDQGGSTTLDGKSCVITRNNALVSVCKDNIKIRLTAPTGSDIKFQSPVPSSEPSSSPTSAPSAAPSTQPSASPIVVCNLGMYIKFQDITSNGPDKFVSLSFRQPGSNNELFKFDSVPVTTNAPPFVNENKDIYRIGVGAVTCGTFDVYLNSAGYQEKKFPNILVDNNSLNDPETYVLYGKIIPTASSPSPSAQGGSQNI